MALDLYIGREMDKPFIEELVRHCISKEIVPISEDTVISLNHFNKVLKVTAPLEILVPKIEVDGFVFYVKNATDEPISVSPMDCSLENGYDPIVVLPNSTIHLSTDELGNYVLLSNSAENNPAGPFFKVLEYTFTCMSPKYSGDVLDVVLPYTVGSNGLTIYSRGTEWYRGFEFEEIGDSHKKSHTVKLMSDIAIGDELLIRVIDSSEHHIHEVNFIAEENYPKGSVYVLPNHMQYHVGSYAVKVSVRGTEWYRTMYFDEVGAFNDVSNMILLLDDINIGDEVCIRTIDVGPVCVMEGSFITDIKTEVIMSNSSNYLGIIPVGENTIDMPSEIDPVTTHISIYLQGVYQLSSSWYIEDGKIIFSEELKTFDEPIEYEIVTYYNSKEKVYVDSGVMVDSSIIYLTKHCTLEQNYIEVYISGIKQTDAGWTLRGNSIVLNKAIRGAIEYEVLIYPFNVMDNYKGVFTEKTNIIKLPKEYSLTDYYIELFISGLHQRSDTYTLTGDTVTLVNPANQNFIYDITLIPKIGVQKTGVLSGSGGSGDSCTCGDRLLEIQDDLVKLGTRVQTLEIKMDNVSTTMNTLKAQMEGLKDINMEQIKELEFEVANKPSYDDYSKLEKRVEGLENDDSLEKLKAELDALKAKLGDTDKDKVDEIVNRIEELEKQIDEIESLEFINELNKRLTAVEERLDNLEKDDSVNNLKAELKDLKEKLGNTDKEQIDSIINRIEELEKQISNIESLEFIDKLNERLTTVEDRLDNLNDSLVNMQVIVDIVNEINDIKNQISNIENNTVNTTDFVDLTDRLAALENKVADYIAGSSTNSSGDVGTQEFADKFEILNEGEFITVNTDE